MAKTIGAEGISLIKEFEGCRLTAYKPVAAEPYFTIGYGHYGPDVTAGMTISEAQAEAYLREDLRQAEQSVNSSYYCPVTAQLNQNQFDALVSFTYNCGSGNLKLLCRDGRTLAQIADHLPAYNKDVTGKVLAGLVRRRNAEVKLFNTPVAPEPTQEPEVKEVQEKRYQTVEQIPEWGKSTVCKLIANGIIKGTDGGLDMSLDMLRVLVWIDRNGLFGEE